MFQQISHTGQYVVSLYAIVHGVEAAVQVVAGDEGDAGGRPASDHGSPGHLEQASLAGQALPPP